MPRNAEESNPKTAEESNDFVPGMETDEDFERVLSLLKKWMKGGIVDVDIKPDGEVEFELSNEMRDLFENDIPDGLTEQQVLRIMRTEVPALVAAGFAKNSANYLRYRLPENLREKADHIATRVEKTMDALVDKELRERLLLRRITLGYVMGDIRSLSGSYESHSHKGEKTSVPFTTLELSFVRPRAGLTLQLDPSEGFAGLSHKDEIQVRVDLHPEDVKALVKELTKLIEKPIVE